MSHIGRKAFPVTSGQSASAAYTKMADFYDGGKLKSGAPVALAASLETIHGGRWHSTASVFIYEARQCAVTRRIFETLFPGKSPAEVLSKVGPNRITFAALVLEWHPNADDVTFIAGAADADATIVDNAAAVVKGKSEKRRLQAAATAVRAWAAAVRAGAATYSDEGPLKDVPFVRAGVPTLLRVLQELAAETNAVLVRGVAGCLEQVRDDALALLKRPQPVVADAAPTTAEKHPALQMPDVPQVPAPDAQKMPEKASVDGDKDAKTVDDVDSPTDGAFNDDTPLCMLYMKPQPLTPVQAAALELLNVVFARPFCVMTPATIEAQLGACKTLIRRFSCHDDHMDRTWTGPKCWNVVFFIAINISVMMRMVSVARDEMPVLTARFVVRFLQPLFPLLLDIVKTSVTGLDADGLRALGQRMMLSCRRVGKLPPGMEHDLKQLHLSGAPAVQTQTRGKATDAPFSDDLRSSFATSALHLFCTERLLVRSAAQADADQMCAVVAGGAARRTTDPQFVVVAEHLPDIAAFSNMAATATTYSDSARTNACTSENGHLVDFRLPNIEPLLTAIESLDAAALGPMILRHHLAGFSVRAQLQDEVESTDPKEQLRSAVQRMLPATRFGDEVLYSFSADSASKANDFSKRTKGGDVCAAAIAAIENAGGCSVMQHYVELGAKKKKDVVKNGNQNGVVPPVKKKNKSAKDELGDLPLEVRTPRVAEYTLRSAIRNVPHAALPGLVSMQVSGGGIGGFARIVFSDPTTASACIEDPVRLRSLLKLHSETPAQVPAFVASIDRRDRKLPRYITALGGYPRCSSSSETAASGVATQFDDDDDDDDNNNSNTPRCTGKMFPIIKSAELNETLRKELRCVSECAGERCKMTASTITPFNFAWVCFACKHMVCAHCAAVNRAPNGGAAAAAAAAAATGGRDDKEEHPLPAFAGARRQRQQQQSNAQ
jgi:hypothetical protein